MIDIDYEEFEQIYSRTASRQWRWKLASKCICIYQLVGTDCELDCSATYTLTVAGKSYNLPLDLGKKLCAIIQQIEKQDLLQNLYQHQNEHEHEKTIRKS